MDGETVAAMLVYGVLGLAPLVYNYRAAQRLRKLRQGARPGSRDVYVVVKPASIDLGELESLLGTHGSLGVVSRVEEAEA